MERGERGPGGQQNRGCEMERGERGLEARTLGSCLGRSETLGTGDSASGTEGACPDPSSEPPLEHRLHLLLGPQKAKHLPAKWETGFQPWLGRSPGEGHGSPLQDSCLENSMDRGAWRAAVHGVAQSRTRLSALTSSSLFSHRWNPEASRQGHLGSVSCTDRIWVVLEELETDLRADWPGTRRENASSSLFICFICTGV